MKLAHFFLDMDLRCSHNGLLAIIQKKKIKIKPDDFIVFLNRKRTVAKMFCGSEVALMHYKGTQIDTAMIRLLPKYCGGGELNMKAALQEHVEALIKRKRR